MKKLANILRDEGIPVSCPKAALYAHGKPSTLPEMLAATHVANRWRRCMKVVIEARGVRPHLMARCGF